MIHISSRLSIMSSDIEITFIRSPGPGGQNVNKVATTAQLRFNVQHAEGIDDDIRLRLLTVLATRLTREGDLILKASKFRTQERNKQDAIHRLIAILKAAVFVPKKRKNTKPTFASTQKRLKTKKRHGETKALRRSTRSQDDHEG